MIQIQESDGSVNIFGPKQNTVGPENFKKFRPKYSSNEINQFHGIFMKNVFLKIRENSFYLISRVFLAWSFSNFLACRAKIELKANLAS